MMSAYRLQQQHRPQQLLQEQDSWHCQHQEHSLEQPLWLLLVQQPSPAAVQGKQYCRWM